MSSHAQGPDPREVRETIDYLRSLTEPEFAKAYALYATARPKDHDDVFGMDSPDPVNVKVAEAAFRSPDLLERSMTAVNFHISRTTNLLDPRRGEDVPAKRAGRQDFLTLMRQHRNVLGSVRKHQAAMSGRVDNAPNPRRRAEKRLWDEVLKGPVKKGRGLELLREEEAIARNRREREKAERKALRKARR